MSQPQPTSSLGPAPPRPKRHAQADARAEAVKIALLLAILLALLGLCLLGYRANQLADEAVVQRMSAAWQKHLHIFIDRPYLRPYFFDRKELTNQDPNRDLVLTVADQRLDAIEAALKIVTPRWSSQRRLDPRNTYAMAFRTGPLLCNRVGDRWQEFEFARSVAQGVCSQTFSP